MFTELDDSISETLKELRALPFFQYLETHSFTPDEHKRFLIQKYVSVASTEFVSFLGRVAEISEGPAPALSKVFRENRDDEIGLIGGELRAEYGHETWRQKALIHLGIRSEEMLPQAALPSTRYYSTSLASLKNTQDFLKCAGVLMLIEIWTVQEMRMLIKSFERDLPEFFPKGGFDRALTPHNPQEYWYNHADHDTRHFLEIREAVFAFLKQNPSPENFRSVREGIELAKRAEASLYSLALLRHCRGRSVA
jgi:hypothetical protein